MYMPIRGMSSNATGRPLGLGITTVLSHIMLPWCKKTLLSIPSHCTMGRSGQSGRTGVVSRCPTGYTLSLLSIPSDCSMVQSGRTGIVPMCPTCYNLSLLSIPSDCSMVQSGRTGIIPMCPTCYTLSLLSIPSHCTMGQSGQTASNRTIVFVHYF